MRYLTVLAISLCALAQQPLASRLQKQAGIKNQNLSPTPPMGWNAFLPFGCSPTEALIEATADAMVSQGLLAVGYTYVNLDDCWQDHQRDNLGNLQPDSTRFPSGIRALATYIHGQGLQFGIYSGAGIKSPSGLAGSWGHEIQDAKQFQSWGANYLKWDVSCCIPGGLSVPVALRSYKTICRALQVAGGNILCTGGGNQIDAHIWAGPVGDVSARIYGDLSLSWVSMDDAGFNATTGIAQYGGPNRWFDLDSLIIGNGLTNTEGQTQFSLWAIQAASLMIGVDIRAGNISANSLATLKNTDVIAVDQDALGIVGVKTSSVACGSSTCEVWVKQLSGTNTCAVGLFNRDSSSHNIAAVFATIAGIVPGCGTGPYTTTRDLWAHSSLGTLTTSYTATAVPAHGVFMFKVAP